MLSLLLPLSSCGKGVNRVDFRTEPIDRKESHRIDIKKLREGKKEVVEELLKNGTLSIEEFKRITGWTPEMFGIDSSTIFPVDENNREAYQAGVREGIETCNNAWIKVLTENGLGIDAKIIESFVKDVQIYIKNKD